MPVGFGTVRLTAKSARGNVDYIWLYQASVMLLSWL